MVKPKIPIIKPTLGQMAETSIIAWIAHNQIKNEKGEPIEFTDHPFLYDIYRDRSDKLVVTKAAQVGLSTLEVLRNHFDARTKKMDIIYTLPTDADVGVFVSGKVNRIIANNPCMLADVKDKDSIEQKAVHDSMIYFRGTWTKKAAIMITADRLVHDEKDSSKQDVIADFQARLEHSKMRQTHVFSHPSVPNNGVDVEWQMSDQKEWFVTCKKCGKEQYLSWNTEDPKKMSIDLEKQIFVCKGCHAEITDDDRRQGRWVQKYKDKEWSGYHVSALMSPRKSAKDIIDKYEEVMKGKQTMDYFYNKILGLPYSGGGNSVPQEAILGSVTAETNLYQGRMVIGVDTGVKLRYVLGNRQGLLGYGEMTDYMPDEVNKLDLKDTIEYFLKKFDNSVMVIDQGGDIIGSRKLAKKYPGRVFLCHYAKDRKTMQLIRWGSGEESGNVVVDRNRLIQLVIDEFKDGRVKLYRGDQNAWYDYWLHWSHIYRTVEEDKTTQMPQYVWMRSDRDDWVHATVYWRVGVDKFGGTGSIIMPTETPDSNSYLINPNQTVDFNPDEMFKLQEEEKESDWRNT